MRENVCVCVSVCVWGGGEEGKPYHTHCTFHSQSILRFLAETK